jgi:light-regulated signal transduction histidine kinase (bacteriophytochrome)
VHPLFAGPTDPRAWMMKPILSQTEDKGTLQDLGRASIQIVHDLKNQLNGLKLYATFLRKRMEKGDRPDDELETIGKLISGLDRAASDLSTIVEYGRKIELKTQPGLDIQKVMRGICTDIEGTAFTCDLEPPAALIGEFDPTKLTDALKWISAGAIKYRAKETEEQVLVTVTRGEDKVGNAEIEWSGLSNLDHDPFQCFIGTVEIRMSLASKIVEAHGGTARYLDNRFVVTLPLTD